MLLVVVLELEMVNYGRQLRSDVAATTNKKDFAKKSAKTSTEIELQKLKEA